MKWMVETTDLTKVLGGTKVVDHVNLSIQPGSIYGIVGANGAGKSTLLRLIAGLIWPEFGEIKLMGETVQTEAAELRQRVHFVAPEGHMYSSFRVQDLLKYAEWLYSRWDPQRCKSLIDVLELPRKRMIKSLSLGMKMQLRLVVSLSAHPDVLLLDEPTNGLDAVVKRQFMQLILDEAARDGTTVLMATHDLNDLERMADGLAVMYRGRTIAQGMIDELKARIHSYQIVLPDGLPHKVYDTKRILHSEQRGSMWTLVVEDEDGTVEKILKEVSTHMEEIPLSLEDVFAHLLRKEGYSREAILLA